MSFNQESFLSPPESNWKRYDTRSGTPPHRMRSIRQSLVLLVALTGASAQDILPPSFAGWESTNKAAVKPAHANVLTEYGLQSAELREYQRSGRRIRVTAFRFSDATGAYGAFTFHRTPDMVKEDLCSGAASARTHVLFFCTNVLIDVELDKVTAMTLAELRALAEALPKLQGPAAQVPTLALYLPEKARNSSLKFVVGPKAYAQLNGAPPAEIVDFSRSPEVIVTSIEAIDGRGTVTLAHYPTPAIAMQQLKRFQEWAQAKPKPTTPAERDTALFRRSGPMVALVTGDIANAEAFDIVGNINYEADVSWTEPTYQHPKDNIGGLVYGSVLLAIFIFTATVIAGVFFGGFRIMLRKWFPERFHDPAEQGELIRLRIDH
jgi:hypothetical protein